MTDMTLEQVRNELRYCAKGNYQVPALVLADAIDAAIKQRDQGANNPLKGWIFDKLAEALRDATYVAGMLDAICETDGTVDHMQARDAAFRVRDALQAHATQAHPPAARVPDEYQEIARLIGSIFCAGGFKAETWNERELERLLKKTGNWFDNVDQVPKPLLAAQKNPNG